MGRSPGISAAAVVLALCAVAGGVAAQNNIVEHDGYFYAAMGGDGVAIIDGERMLENPGNVSDAFMEVPEGAESVDDLTVADGYLFALDAEEPASITVYSLKDPLKPKKVDGPKPVSTSNYAGISASRGYVVMAGGTSALVAYEYNNKTGKLSDKYSSMSYGGSQNDVVLADDGKHAYVSTDFGSGESNQRFGITGIKLNKPEQKPDEEFREVLRDFGISEGSMQPANFPMSGVAYSETRNKRTENFVLVAGGPGLSVLLVTDPKEARVIGTTSLPMLGMNVAKYQQGDTRKAYVVGSSPRAMLVELDLSVLPNTPSTEDGETVDLQTLGDNIGAVCEATGVAVSKDVVAVAANDCGIMLFKRKDLQMLGMVEAMVADRPATYDDEYEGDAGDSSEYVSTLLPDDVEGGEGADDPAMASMRAAQDYDTYGSDDYKV